MAPVLAILLVLAGAMLAAALGVGAVWWALFADKPRGRRRCPRCWHDLTHTPGLVCGECGHPARRPADLLRTRRRWGLAALALAAILGVTIWARFAVTQAGWESLMPNAALVGLAPFMEPSSAMDAGWRELARRVWRRELGTGEQVALAERLGGMRNAGRLRTAPADLLRDVLRRMPAELEPDPDRDDPAREETEREYRAALDRAVAPIPLAVDMALPRQCVEGGPLTVFLNGALWGQRTEWRATVARALAWPVAEESDPAQATDAAAARADAAAAPGPAGAALALAPTFDGWVVWSSRGDLRYDSTPAAVVQLDGPPPGPHRVEVALRTEVRRWDWRAGAWGPWTPAPAVTAEALVNVGAPLRVAPLDTPELREAIQAAFESPAIAWIGDERPIGVRYNAVELAASRHSQLLIGVVLELLERGEPRRRMRFWWQAGRGPAGRGGSAGWEIQHEDLPALRRLREDPSGWTIRVRGDLPAALRAFHPNARADAPLRYWNGQIEFPLRVERQNRPAPERVWRFEPRETP
jgi:hypothetical protein